MESIESKLINKKINEYGSNHEERNFIIQNEITVTITLEEYRDLVTTKATTDVKIKAAEADKYERNQRSERLEKENAALKAELYELQKKLDAATGAVEEEE